jgi:tetratricopeptide (TPR) repeat protein
MARKDDIGMARSYSEEWSAKLKGGHLTENDEVQMFKDMGRAKKLIDGVLKEDPDDLEAQAALGLWHLCKARDEGRYKAGRGKALAHMEEVVRLVPESANNRCALGLLYALVGKRGPAVEQLEKAVELEPSNAEFRKELDRLKSEKGGCFIATAVYGSPLANEVSTLCEFRDRVLSCSLPGRGFIKLYYLLSPQFAAFLGRHEMLRRAVRTCIVAPLAMKAKAALAGRHRRDCSTERR